MLHYLLDAHLCKDLPQLVVSLRPGIQITGIVDWHNGIHLNADDDVILVHAHREQLTLVTYDRATIPTIVTRFAESGNDHGGVIFIDNQTISQKDIGGLAWSLIAHWDERHTWPWINRI